MSTITVLGVPSETSREKLDQLTVALADVVVTRTHIDNPRQVNVWFPQDLSRRCFGEVFSIDVACLNADVWGELDIRSARGSDLAAEHFCKVVAPLFPQYQHIECEVRPFRNCEGGHAFLTRDES